MRALDADLGVVAAYGKILTDAVLAIPRLGLINVHASLLPKYRGAAPIHRAVMAGETETGVTIMRVVKALDAGPMIAKVTRPIGEDETSAEVERDIARLGARAARRGRRRDRRGARVGDAAGRSRGDLRAQDREGRRHHRLVAAGASTFTTRFAASIRGRTPIRDLQGERTILLRSEVERGAAGQRERRPAPCSTRTPISFTVQTGDGVLRLLTLQREGRRPVTAREFLAGRRIEPGARFVPSRSRVMIAPARTAAFTALRDVNAGRARSACGACARSARRFRTSAIARWRPTSSPARCAGSGSSTTSSSILPSDRSTKLDFEVLQILRLGAYQLLHLDRVPAAAAVNDAVAMTRRARKTSAAGLVNAVLRGDLAQRARLPLPLRPPEGDRASLSGSLAVSSRLARRRWLDAVWIRRGRSVGDSSTTPPRR